VRAYLFPLPSFQTGFWSPYLADRFVLIGTAQYFRDARSGQEARNYSAQAQYNLAGCKTGDTGCRQGTAAISFEYDHGTDVNTLVSANKYMVKLNYKQ
jgi:hypothetical protein